MQVTRDWLIEQKFKYSEEEIFAFIPEEGLSKVELLQLEYMPEKDRIWIATRPSFLSTFSLMLFMGACGRRSSDYSNSTLISPEAANVARAAFKHAQLLNKHANLYNRFDAYSVSDIAYNVASSAYIAAFAANAADTELLIQIKHLIALLPSDQTT